MLGSFRLEGIGGASCCSGQGFGDAPADPGPSSGHERHPALEQVVAEWAHRSYLASRGGGIGEHTMGERPALLHTPYDTELRTTARIFSRPVRATLTASCFQ